MGLETDHIVKTSTKMTIEAEGITIIEVATEIIGPIIGITVDPTIETTTEIAIGTITDQIIEEMTVTRVMVTEIRTMIGLEKGIEIGETGVAQEESSQSRSSSRSQSRQSRSNTRNRDRSEARSRSSSCVSTNRNRCRCYRCNEYDHFARKCPNDATGRYSDDAKGSLLRMLDTDQTYALDYAEGEDYGMDLNM